MAYSKQKTLDPITVLLLGSAGSGKSFVGNILLSRTSDHKLGFKERSGPRIENRVRKPEVHRKEDLKVIETFDLMNSSLKEEEYEAHMEEWLKAADNNIDLVILVIRGDARYTKYNHDLYTCFEKYWKTKMDRSCPLNLVFTAKDILTKNKIDIKDEIMKDTISSELKELRTKFKNCEYVGKPIKGKEERYQRKEEDDQRKVLFKMIETARKRKIAQRKPLQTYYRRTENIQSKISTKPKRPATTTSVIRNFASGPRSKYSQSATKSASMGMPRLGSKGYETPSKYSQPVAWTFPLAMPKHRSKGYETPSKYSQSAARTFPLAMPKRRSIESHISTSHR